MSHTIHGSGIAGQIRARPASTLFVVKERVRPDLLVEVELIAAKRLERQPTSNRAILVGVSVGFPGPCRSAE